MRYWRLAWLIVALAGCGGGDLADAISENIDASLTSDSTAAPVPFDSIPLSQETSFDSQPAGEGSEPGEEQELTPLAISFCWCPPGKFEMGSGDNVAGHLNNESRFDCTISRGFWLQQTEVTQAQFEELMGSNPSHFKGRRNPVDSVTWLEAVEFCRRLSSLPPEQRAGNTYRLPTEAEWEYACRAGTISEFSFGDDAEQLEHYGWYQGNSERTTHPVGEKLPNAWALLDMHGNVAEWCQDYYAGYPVGGATDPAGPNEGDKRTLRGGGWFFVPMFARSAHRDAYVPTARYVGLGFRVVATSQPVDPGAPSPPDAE